MHEYTYFILHIGITVLKESATYGVYVHSIFKFCICKEEKSLWIIPALVLRSLVLNVSLPKSIGPGEKQGTENINKLFFLHLLVN